MLNRQREAIYAERRRVLEGEDLHEQVRHFLDDVVDGYVDAATADGFAEDWDLDPLWTALQDPLPGRASPSTRSMDEAGGRSRHHRRDARARRSSPTPTSPTTQREEALGAEVMRELERRVVLSVLDRKWREHLYEMDYLQEGIGLRAMAQRDPLVEYQREGFLLFQAMIEAIKEESVGYLFNLEVEVEAPAASAAVQDDVPVDGFEAARAIRGQGPRGAAGPGPAALLGAQRRRLGHRARRGQRRAPCAERQGGATPRGGSKKSKRRR